MKSARLPLILAIVLATLGVGGYFYGPKLIAQFGGTTDTAQEAQASAPVAQASAIPAQPSTPTGNANMTPPDFTVDTSGLSKALVTLTTTKGVIKYRFYSNDAPKTSARMAELIGKGFYNGLTFHRVVPGFVIQGGDPSGNGTGGSGQKLQAEFNTRKHVEGTVAMARSQDPNSADSQFYFSLGTHPHLDRQYTVFGQVIEGMDVAKKIQVGDKMLTVVIENQ